ISERALEKILPIDVAIEAAEEAFRAHSSGLATIPLRSEIHRENPAGTALIMPGLIDNKVLGVKLIGSVTNGVKPPSKSTTCMLLIWDARTLRPRGLVSADRLNDHRTAAGFAAATRILARSESEVHAIFGAGKLSFCSVLYVARVRPIKKLIIVSRTPAPVKALVAQVRDCEDLADLEISTSRSADQAAAEADIITTVTTSDNPVFNGRFVRPGTHINLGGAFRPHQREMDDAIAARAIFWVDSIESCRARAGDILLPLQAGIVHESQHSGELGDVLLGKNPGRRSGEEITVFKSLGLATQDLVLAGRVLDLAEEKDLGSVFDEING